jgi:hypothetical protein
MPTTYSDTAVSNGTQYSYTVSAVNAVGEGPQSAAQLATPMVPSGGGSPNLPTNQLVAAPSYRTISWGGSYNVDAGVSMVDTWKTWGFYGGACSGVAPFMPGAVTGSGQLASDVPNTQGSSYNWQRAYEGYAVQGVNITGVPTPGQRTNTSTMNYQHTTDPLWECFMSVHPDGGNPNGRYPPAGWDWWDDAGWNTVAAWWGLFARDIKNVWGGSGTGFDTESGNWDETVVPNAGTAGRTVADVQLKVFQRGYQCGTAFWQNFPDGRIHTYDYRHSGGFQQWLSGWYNGGNTDAYPAGGQGMWHLGWVKAMADFGSANSMHQTMDAAFYIWGEYGLGTSADARSAKLKLNAERGMACMSQEFPLGIGQASWSKACDRIIFMPSAWPDGASDKTSTTPASTWAAQVAVDHEWSMAPYRSVYHGSDSGDAPGGFGGTPSGQWYLQTNGVQATPLTPQGHGTTHLAGNQAASTQTPLPGDTATATCINISWTGSTLTCQAAHKYGVIYVKVYSGANFNPNNLAASYLGAMQMNWIHPSLADYHGTPGGGGSTTGHWPTLARVADSYQQCTFTTAGVSGDWRVLQVVTTRLDVSWFKVQHP